jgi:hypothetical protein
MKDRVIDISNWTDTVEIVTHDSWSTWGILPDSWMGKAVGLGVRHDWTEECRLASWTLSSFSFSSSLSSLVFLMNGLLLKLPTHRNRDKYL